jgi:hypothetical protein
VGSAALFAVVTGLFLAFPVVAAAMVGTGAATVADARHRATPIQETQYHFDDGVARHRQNHGRHNHDRVQSPYTGNDAPSDLNFGAGQPVGCGFGGICHGGR